MPDDVRLDGTANFDGERKPVKVTASQVVSGAKIVSGGSEKTLPEHLGDKAALGANEDITSLAALTDSLPTAARTALERYLSNFINGLPKSDAGLAVGKLWNNGGMITRVEP